MHRIEIRDFQTVSYHRTGSRATSGPDRHIQFFAGSTDEVHYDEEITRETHGDDGVELELDTFFQLLVRVQALLSVTLQSSVHGQMAQIGRLKCQTVGIILLFAETLRDVEFRHNRTMVDVIDLDLIDNLLRVGKCFGDVAEDFSHFIGCFQPFLLGIVHSVDIVDVMVRTQTDESVVRFGIFLVDEVGVIGSNDFDVVFAREFKKNRVDLFLALIDILVASGFLGLMALELDVVVLAEEGLEPLNGLFRLRKISTFGDSIEDFLR